MNRRSLLALLTAGLLLLSGCGSSQAPLSGYPTLPPAQAPYDAPVDDLALRYEADIPLYLPSMDGQRLLCQYTAVALQHGVSPVRAVAEALLRHPGSVDVRPLGGGVSLSLHGDRPVALAGGVCTVNLASTALQLDRQALYTVCLSIAATLCELPQVQAVNVLVAGQAVALDIIGCLPLGSVTPRPGEELAVLWDLVDARRTPLGENPAAVPLTATATLYFPMAETEGFMPETRTLSFPGQHPEQLAAELVNALSAGAQRLSGAAAMPNLSSLMAHTPTLTELEDGGRLLSLYFVPGLESALHDLGLSSAVMLGAIHRTMTTFIPSVSQVRMYEGSNLITSLTSDSLGGALLFPDGLMQRQQFDPLLLDQASLSLVDGGHLAMTPRVLPCVQAQHPRLLIGQLLDGVTEAEAARGLSSPLPAGLTSADILGLALTEDGTLLVNLSDAFAQALTDFNGSEGLACYALVNTLCESMGVARVRFFFNGQVRETLAGELYWGGEFLRSPGVAS